MVSEDIQDFLEEEKARRKRSDLFIYAMEKGNLQLDVKKVNGEDSLVCRDYSKATGYTEKTISRSCDGWLEHYCIKYPVFYTKIEFIDGESVDIPIESEGKDDPEDIAYEIRKRYRNGEQEATNKLASCVEIFKDRGVSEGVLKKFKDENWFCGVVCS